MRIDVVDTDGDASVQKTTYVCNGVPQSGGADADAGATPSVAGGVVCPSTPGPVQGVDVSSVQGAVEWPKVQSSGTSFAFVRAADGLSTDPNFATNWTGMKSSGIVRGAFHTFHPEVDPTNQATTFMSALSLVGGLSASDLPPVADVELTGGMPSSTIQTTLQTWLDSVQAATNRMPMIYVNAAFANTNLGIAFGKYPLWIADFSTSCPTVPRGWATWVFWQTTGAGMVPGINGATNLDVFNGTSAQLTSLGTTADAGLDGY